MIPFHSVFPELAQREVRCVQVGPAQGGAPEFAKALLNLFQRVVLNEPYRLRLKRHYRMFRKELARRAASDL